jgi:tripartite-type tricarboxylate transporter receptor subunit TctC
MVADHQGGEHQGGIKRRVAHISEREAMKLPRRQFLHLAVGAAALPAVSHIAWAQSYPTRPIRLVVPFPPGGAFDTLARPWVEQVKPLLGTMIVENIGGGGSSLGAAAVARARPDGYTILLGGSLPHVNEALFKSRPLYDPVKDLDPIAGLAVIALTLAVHPSVPAQNLKEFVAYAKANAGTGEKFKLLAGLPELTQVPYRGGGPVIADLISGQVVMGVVGLTSQLLEFHRSGKLRILAVTSPERLIAAPVLPTVAEGSFPGLTNQSTIGPVAPAGTPKPIIEQIAQAVRTPLAEPAYQQKLIDSGFEASPDTTPEKFRRRLEADVAFWTPVVEAVGLKID